MALRILSRGCTSTFVMAMMRHHICSLYAALGIPEVRPGALPGLSHVWRRLYEYMSQALVLINSFLIKNMPVSFVLARIMDVMSVEVRFSPLQRSLCSA